MTRILPPVLRWPLLIAGQVMHGAILLLLFWLVLLAAILNAGLGVCREISELLSDRAAWAATLSDFRARWRGERPLW